MGFFFQMAGLWHTTFLILCKILAGSNHQLSLTLTLWMDDCGLRVELWECVGSGDWDEGHSILDLLEARYILDLWRQVRDMKNVNMHFVQSIKTPSDKKH